MTPERLAILKTMCERGHAKWREKHGDRPCDVLDINAELIAEVEALTADRDAWKAALVTERIKANIREAYPRGVGRSPYEPVGVKREATR